MAADTPLTYRMTVSYDGKDFAGWQVQPRQRTVQGSIQQTLSRLFGHPITIHGSGRTDTGVHALGQVFHFSGTATIPIERMLKAVNSCLPKDIAITDAVIADPRFHARYDVHEKTYRYRILNTPVRSPLHHHYAWHIPEPLDIAAMEPALPLLLGTHDFAGFAASGSSQKTTVRSMTRAAVWQEGDEILLEFAADGFLYHMVRNLAGTLVDVGRGRKQASWVADIMAAGNRSLAGITAPPQGLYLMHVKY